MPDSYHPELERRVRALIVKTFRLSAHEANNDLRIGAPPQWDSLGHMQLLVAIETEFGITFPIFQVAQLITVDKIVQAIEAQTLNQQ